jgi:hypothetical protein
MNYEFFLIVIISIFFLRSKSDNKIKPYLIQSDCEKSSKIKNKIILRGYSQLLEIFLDVLNVIKKSERIIV